MFDSIFSKHVKVSQVYIVALPTPTLTVLQKAENVEKYVELIDKF